MDRLESSSREILSKLFEQLSEWRKTRKSKPVKVGWSEFHLCVVHGYVLKLKINPASSFLELAILLSQEFSNKTVQEDSAERDGKVASFMHALHEVFVVPQQHRLFERDPAVKKNGLVAAFIDMLLRLLHNMPRSVHSVEDRLDSLRKGLRFLLAVLGDESFISNDQHLWAEFEAVANEAGSFVHLIIFSTLAYPMDDGALVRHIEQLKAKIIKLSNLQHGISETGGADSLFIIDSLLGDLEDVLNREDDTIADVKKQIKILQWEFKLLKSLIKNQEMEELKEYVVRIGDVAYQAEYLINSFLEEDAPHLYLSIRLSHVLYKIKSINSGIQGIKRILDIDVARFSQLSLQNKSSNDFNEIIGFEGVEMEILQYLDGGKEDLQIVSIVGMPGLGKTTLARKLYNHPSLKHKFDVCSWCVVSQQYQKKNLLIDILVSLRFVLDREEMLNIQEESLTTVIHQLLYKRRYLIVIDDLWSSDAWYDLQTCFPNNVNGSRIMLTSRNRNVAPTGSIICELPPMSDEHCWELLKKKVFHNESCPQQLLKLGKKIAESCCGVPLAVVVIAGVLSNKDTKESSWKEVEGNLASYILSSESNSMMQIVELSYKNLADHLRPCFLYFGVFPQGEQILVADLLRLWIAEGFVSREDGKRAENTAKEYLMELINRSLVTVAKTRLGGGVKDCAVHDLLHEFCMKRCQHENQHTLVDKSYSMLNEKYKRFCIRDFVSSPKLPLFGLHVRSVLGCFSRSGFLNMKLLRVLVLQGIVCHGSLNEIRTLVNLRCLAIGYGLSSQKLEGLNLAFISSLVSLEFLQIKSQFYLVYIPSAMAKMVKLRHIDVNTQVYFGQESITSNNTLEFLSKVMIRELKDEQMLRCSPHLRQLKCKCSPLAAEETGEFRYPDFSFFTQLESLHIEAGFVNTVMDISLPLNVKELILSGLFLPWEKMSVIGRLQNLQILKLLFGAFDGEAWETRDGEFTELRWLTLKTVYDLREWKVESSSHFPRLGWLVLDDCQHLQEIPAAVGEITTLEVVEIKGYCQETLLESARQIKQQQREDGNEELKFNIHKVTGFTSETAGSFLLDSASIHDIN